MRFAYILYFHQYNAVLLQSIYAPEKKADFDFDDYGYSDKEIEDRDKKTLLSNENISTSTSKNSETMMYMVDKFNGKKKGNK